MKYGMMIVGLLVAMVAGAAQAQQDPYAEALGYKFGDSRKALMAVEAEIRSAKGDAAKAIEAKLLSMLASPKATTDCKGWACRQLRVIGSNKSVAPLAALLGDKDLSVPAQIAMQSLPGADEALREMLAKLEGANRAGVVQVLGARRDAKAVALIAPLVADKDPATAGAAIYALGEIGGTDALAALQKASVADGLKRERFNAILLCADRMLSAGQVAEASAIYNGVFKEADDNVVKMAALRGIVLADKGKAATVVGGVLKGGDAKLCSAVAPLLREAGDAQLANALLADLATYAPAVQVSLLGLASDPAALEVARKALASTDTDVRKAAIDAVGRLGGAADVAALLAAAEKDEAAAQVALGRLKDAKVDGELLACLAKAQGKSAAVIVSALSLRNAKAALPELLKLAEASKEPAVVDEIGRALPNLAGVAQLPELVKALTASQNPQARAALAAAISAIAVRQNGRAEAADLLVPAMSGASAELKKAILDLLGRMGGDKALAAVRSARADADPAIKEAATRAIIDWSDDAAAGDILAIATSETGAIQVLAVRGYARLAAANAKTRPAPETLTMFRKAAELAKRKEDRTFLLSKLGDVTPTPELLAIATAWLDDPEVKLVAAMSSLRLADGLTRSHPTLAAETATRIKAMKLSQPITRQADQVLAKTKK